MLVAYAWHPWAGHLVCIHETIEWPTGIQARCRLTGADGVQLREVPLWMFDAAVCQLMWTAAEPVAAPSALAALRSLLSEPTGGAAAVSPHDPLTPHPAPPDGEETLQSCGVVAPGRELRCQLTPIPRARNPPDHASTPHLCMLPPSLVVRQRLASPIVPNQRAILSRPHAKLHDGQTAWNAALPVPVTLSDLAHKPFQTGFKRASSARPWAPAYSRPAPPTLHPLHKP